MGSTVVTAVTAQQQSAKNFAMQRALLVAVVAGLMVSGAADAATTGGDFKSLYDFIYGAATGYLGRSIAVFAGVAGLAVGAIQGKAMPAILGVILAVFGTLGPAIINTLFKSAII